MLCTSTPNWPGALGEWFAALGAARDRDALAETLLPALVAAVLALAVLALGRWLRPSPAVLHGLWLIVLLVFAGLDVYMLLRVIAPAMRMA